jgi:hypothetical protein
MYKTIIWDKLLEHQNFLEILNENFYEIDWKKSLKLLEEDKNAFRNLKRKFGEINWRELHLSLYARGYLHKIIDLNQVKYIHYLVECREKSDFKHINWKLKNRYGFNMKMFKNPDNIFEYEYNLIKDRCTNYKDELFKKQLIMISNKNF